MEPRLVAKPAFAVVGLRIRTTPMAPEIPLLWQTFGPRIDELANLAEPRVSYGLMGHFDHQTQQFDYMAGVSLLPSAELPPGLVRWDLPGATYAVFDASLASLGEVFGHVFNHWLPSGAYQMAPTPYFERYGEAFDPADPKSLVEIFIPVVLKPA